MGVLVELNVTTLADPRPPSRWKRQIYLVAKSGCPLTSIRRLAPERTTREVKDTPKIIINTNNPHIKTRDRHYNPKRQNGKSNTPRVLQTLTLHSSSQHCHCLGLPTRISQIKDISGCDTDQHT